LPDKVSVPISLSPSPVSSDQDAKRLSALESLSKLPPFSPILSKLMASLGGEDVSFAVLGDLIEKDTVLAGNILRVVNSAVFARRGTVNSVRRALSVLGLEKVRNTILAMSVSRMLHQVKEPSGWSMERFNKHSAAVAMLSDLLAQHVPTEYGEGAFVGGLLHDVGRMLIAMGLPKEYAEIRDLYQATGRQWVDCEMEVLGFNHAGLSADAMDHWKLPEQIRAAIQRHHAPPPMRDGAPAPLARILHAADVYVNTQGYSVAVGNEKDPQKPAPLFEELGLDDEAQERLLEQFKEEHNAIAQYYH
jgi:putative nucleotidyltransferase with HDIG domain